MDQKSKKKLQKASSKENCQGRGYSRSTGINLKFHLVGYLSTNQSVSMGESADWIDFALEDTLELFLSIYNKYEQQSHNYRNESHKMQFCKIFQHFQNGILKCPSYALPLDLNESEIDHFHIVQKFHEF